MLKLVKLPSFFANDVKWRKYSLAKFANLHTNVLRTEKPTTS